MTSVEDARNALMAADRRCPSSPLLELPLRPPTPPPEQNRSWANRTTDSSMSPWVAVVDVSSLSRLPGFGRPVAS